MKNLQQVDAEEEATVGLVISGRVCMVTARLVNGEVHGYVS